MRARSAGTLFILAALAAGCGSSPGTRYATFLPPRFAALNPAVVTSTYSATLHFHGGQQSLSFRLHEPAGVILLYRISAPRGVKVHGTAQLPLITVPLHIATRRPGPASSCVELPSRIVCTVGEEWCPMPEGTWHFRVDKLSGPAGDVRLWFRVGTPPGG